jgi:soluble lytic murein transglycosylase-like protein
VKFTYLLIALSAYAQQPDLTSKQTPAGQQRAAMDLQKQASRKQAEAVGAWLRPFDPPRPLPPGPVIVLPEATSSDEPCERLADEDLSPIIDETAKKHSVEPNLLRAVIEQESGAHPCALSPKGAQGLMQLMPATAQELGVSDPFDPSQSIEGGAKYLKQLLDRYKGDLSQALAAYNAGLGTVDKAGGIPDIPETRDYVNAIMQRLNAKPLAPPSIPMPKPIEN